MPDLLPSMSRPKVHFEFPRCHDVSISKFQATLRSITKHVFELSSLLRVPFLNCNREVLFGFFEPLPNSLLEQPTCSNWAVVFHPRNASRSHVRFHAMSWVNKTNNVSMPSSIKYNRTTIILNLIWLSFAAKQFHILTEMKSIIRQNYVDKFRSFE